MRHRSIAPSTYSIGRETGLRWSKVLSSDKQVVGSDGLYIEA
jgi:hypothetical protein